MMGGSYGSMMDGGYWSGGKEGDASNYVRVLGGIYTDNLPNNRGFRPPFLGPRKLGNSTSHSP